MSLPQAELDAMRRDITALLQDIGEPLTIRRGASLGTSVATVYGLVLTATDRTMQYMTTYAGQATVGTIKPRTIKLPWNAAVLDSDYIDSATNRYQVLGLNTDVTNRVEVMVHAKWVRAL